MKHSKCEKITLRNCLRMIKNLLSFALGMSGVILVLGTAGSSDLGMAISFGQIITRALIASLLILSGIMLDYSWEV